MAFWVYSILYLVLSFILTFIWTYSIFYFVLVSVCLCSHSTNHFLQDQYIFWCWFWISGTIDEAPSNTPGMSCRGSSNITSWPHEGWMYTKCTALQKSGGRRSIKRKVGWAGVYKLSPELTSWARVVESPSLAASRSFSSVFLSPLLSAAGEGEKKRR